MKAPRTMSRMPTISWGFMSGLAPGDVETLRDGDENVGAGGKADVAVLRGRRVYTAGRRADHGADDGSLGVLTDDLSDDCARGCADAYLHGIAATDRPSVTLRRER